MYPPKQPITINNGSSHIENLRLLIFFILHIVRRSLVWLNNAPMYPPKQPITINNGSSHIENSAKGSPEKELNSPNENNLAILACPQATSTFFIKNNVAMVLMAQKNDRHVNFVLQYDAPPQTKII